VSVPRPPIACPWLQELAAGYLRQHTTVYPQAGAGLWGYSFEREQGRRKIGFFAGFLTGGAGKRVPASASLTRPECAVLAFAHPVGSALHRRLVREPGSLFRRSFELLTKYTNRRPRFEFHEKEVSALIRHLPLAAFPRRQREKYARNFFVETLALLVRSGLPSKLLRVRLAGR
jgi:hypothetical protein